MSFGIEQVNDAWGFFGELTGDSNVSGAFNLNKEDALVAFNAAVTVLGGDPDKALQFLNSSAGRHLGDSLTSIIDGRKETTLRSVLKAIAQIPAHSQTKWAVDACAKFKKFESMKPQHLVDRLLSEDATEGKSAEVAELVKGWLADKIDPDAVIAKVVALGLLDKQEASDAEVESGSAEHERCDIFFNDADWCLSLEDDGTSFRTDCREMGPHNFD